MSVFTVVHDDTRTIGLKTHVRMGVSGVMVLNRLMNKLNCVDKELNS